MKKRYFVAVICILVLTAGCAQKTVSFEAEEKEQVPTEEKEQVPTEEKEQVPTEEKEQVPTEALLVLYQVQPGDTLYELFGQDWKVVARLNRVSPRHLSPGMILIIPWDMEEAESLFCPLPVKIETDVQLLVDLREQAMGRYEKQELQAWYPIASGRKNYATPAGLFRILQKELDYKSRTYPKPDGGAPMPYALRFYGGYWIHGGTLPGKPASHGCVRLILEEAKEVFEHSQIGDKLLIKDGLD